MSSVTQAAGDVQDPRERIGDALRHARPEGLSTREAERRLVRYGPNELARRAGRMWPRQLAAQLTHPLALLLWAAALLALVAGLPPLAIAIVVVVAVNAAFAFAQERHAERAVEALAGYLPQQATVVRDGRRTRIRAAELVPGDVLVVEEGDRVSADARLLRGEVEVDLATLTGESQPVLRSAAFSDKGRPLVEARDLVFSGTVCVAGEARALVFATGMQTELGRIAALAERTKHDPSPLEHQVRRVARLIAVVAIVAGLVFVPVGWLAAGLPLDDALVFAIGLIVANVPEGLLPTITLSLAVGVAALARRGALVKRLSAVETLGSTSVICTDKTGTLTENRMRPLLAWTAGGEVSLEDEPVGDEVLTGDTALALLAEAAAACSSADVDRAHGGKSRGEATEVGMLLAAERLGADIGVARRERQRRGLHRFDPTLRLMTTVDETDAGLVLHTKGAPEEVLARCSDAIGPTGAAQPLGELAPEIAASLDAYARRGLRVLALARRALPPGAERPTSREEAEQQLSFLGLVALFDPPRPEVADAVAACHAAGIRVIVVTGDYGPTAVEIARRVGIVGDERRRTVTITGEELDGLSDRQLDVLLADEQDVVFARSSPEAKLRIADALRATGRVVAMTGDGVNDAPALRRADIGVAMGLTGTDVAREAATLLLTDDNFATIVRAIEAGRTVYDNVRKFVVYIFAHATPEVVPFLVFALSGGAVPLPLTVLQILAIDLGTELLPALALGREPGEPGLMTRPPRPGGEGLVQREMLVRAWVFLGLVEAALVLGGFFWVLWRAGWGPGDPTGAGSPLHGTYLTATTMTFAGIVACQIGTALAARTDRASLRSVGLGTNPLLLWAIASEIAFTAAVIYLPPLQTAFGTAALGLPELAVLATFPVVVWGSDELRRWLLRSREGRATGPLERE